MTIPVLLVRKGKQDKASCKAKTLSFMNQPLQILHMDLFGPTFVRSINHKTYCLVFTNGFSRFSWVYFLKSKDETTQILKDFIRQAENQFNHKVKTIRSNNGTEFKNNELIEFCGLKGTKREYSNARTPQQNGIAKRKNMTLIEAARTIPFECHVTILNTIDQLGKFDGKSDSGPKEANISAGTQANDDQSANSKEIDLHEKHFVLPIWSAYSTTFKSSRDKTEKNTDFKTCEKPNANTNSTNLLNTVSAPLSAAGPSRAFNDSEPSYPDDPSMPYLKDIYASPSEGIFTDSSYDDEGVTRSKVNKNSDTYALVSYIQKQQRNNHKDFQHCLFDCFLSQIKPKKIPQALKDKSWVDAMQEELMQFQIQKSAFLYGTINEEVYVSQPPGFVDPKFSNKVYKVVKALYGLHQAPRAWYATFSTFLEKSRYRRGAIDKTLFIKQYKKDVIVKTTSTPTETQKPLVKDKEAADLDVHLYRYLKGQPKLGLWYPKVSSFDLEAYSDSDYAGVNLDKKSITGGCQFLGRRLILWQCKKQTIEATSTIKVENVATAHCCRQVLWIQNQLLDYGFNIMNTKIYIDNGSIICIVKNLVFHSKTKHIEIRHHFIRDAYEKKLIQVLKIHTDDNVANLLTKAFDFTMSNPHQELASPKANGVCKELASPKQMALGKDISNPFMAGSLPKTIWPKLVLLVLIKAQDHISNESPLSGVNTPRCDDDSLKLMKLMVFLVQFDEKGGIRVTAGDLKKKVVVIEDVIRQALHLDDADGVVCLPNEEIFTELARMGYEKPPPNAKRTAWNEFSCSMASAVICLATVVINAQVDDLSSHTIKYTSPALTQKVFANMRRVGKGFSGVETLLFAKMLVQLQPPDAEEENEVKVPNAPQAPITTPPQAPPAPPSSPPHEQPTDTSESSMTLLNTLMETSQEEGQEVKEKEEIKAFWFKELMKGGGKIAAIDADEDITLMDAETQVDMNAKVQGRIVDVSAAAIKEFNAVKPTVFDDEEVTMTMAQTLIKMKAKKARLLNEQMAKRKPISIAQARKNMIIYLKNMAGYKMEHFRGITYDKESFKMLKAVEVSGSESTHDTSTNDPKEISEDDVKNMLEIVPVYEFKVEALQSSKIDTAAEVTEDITLIEQGPLLWPSVEEDGVTRLKKYSELLAVEAIQADCDVKATNIILQGLPPEVYALVSTHKVNTKFLNTLPPEWSKFVTDVKLVKDLHTTNIDQLHAYLGQHEYHANEVRLMHEQTSDPLALISQRSGGTSRKQRVIVCYNCKGEGHMSKQCTKPKRKRDVEWFKEKVLLVQAQANEQ
nr:hypothetical protein [Tanacetum cinerariifolium]